MGLCGRALDFLARRYPCDNSDWDKCFEDCVSAYDKPCSRLTIRELEACADLCNTYRCYEGG